MTVRPDLYERSKNVLVSQGMLEIEGVLQTREGISVRALEARPLPTQIPLASRDFR